MRITIELELDLEKDPHSLGQVLRLLADTLDSDAEPDVNVMDGSLNVKNLAGEKVGTLQIDEE